MNNIKGMQYENKNLFTIHLQGYSECGAVQCGFCTPGMLMATEALLRVNPQPTIEEIRQALSGNICRCTGYNMIVEAVCKIAKEGNGLW